MTDPTTTRRRSFKIWHLTRKDDDHEGGLAGFFIIAELEQQARFAACDWVEENGNEEDRCVWLDPRKSHVQELGKADARYNEVTVITSFYQGE
jgi:hypothetical protein